MTELDKALKIIGYLCYFLPVVFIVTGLPLALKRIAPNNTYGFRTAKTFANSDTWYSVNHVGGIAFVIAGLLSIGLIFMVQNYWTVGQITKLIASFCIPLILVVIAVIAAFTLG